nr:hypothetical protein [Tanacetum cinerariifolium]
MNRDSHDKNNVPWIYMAQFWHTLKEDGLKYRVKFMLDRKELSLTLDDFRTIFHLLQATDNNHDSFVPPPSFSDMIPFYKNHLGFTMELKIPSSFKTTGLLQPWRALCKIFSKCLTMQLLWEGYHYSLLHFTYSIPYQRFTKIIIGHYMTNFPKISRQWMITEAMKQMKHYRMYAKVFGIDVPLIQSLPTEFTQGTHRTPSAPRSPTPKVDASALTRSTVIRLHLPQQRSTRLTPPAPILTDARENVMLVEKHLASEEIEKMVDGQEHVGDDSLIPKNDEHNILGTRLEPRSDKESPEVGIIDVIVHVNVYDEKEEEDKITNEVYELK